jgi:TPR repeat protein
MKMKIILLCIFCILTVTFNAIGLGGGSLTVSPNYGPEIAAENDAALAAAREASNQQAEQQYAIALAQQQQEMDEARQKLWDDAVSKIKNEAQRILDNLSEQYSPNLNELNSQQRILQLVATNLNEQRIQSETRNNLLRAKQMFQPKDPWRMLDGKVCCAKDQGWLQFSGNILEVKANGIMIEGDFGPPLENGYGKRIYFVENFPNATYPFADGENINKNMDFVAHMGEKSVFQYTNTTINYGVETVRRLDYGKIVNSPPPDLIKKWEIPIIVAGGADDDIIAEIKTNQAQLSAVTQTLSQFQSDYDQKTKQILDDRDAKIRDLPNTLAKQAKEQQDKAKQQQAAKILAFNQAEADKGDFYGLLRMGERYRDGDGVSKDLGKARDYLAKAAAAGSPTAADELSKLNQASTNSPATQ